ncbi:MAG TPA: alpha/beta hydrolase [Candidatus Anoxymicrobiaceae bacterium]
MLFRDLFITACTLTGQTERAASRLGVGYFLPSLFKLRYANMGGLDRELFGRQLMELKTFEESSWCSYWNGFAEEYELEAERLLGIDPGDADERAQDLLIKACTYYQVSAFPGDGPLKMKAYFKSREMFDRGNELLGRPAEKVTLDIAGEEVVGYSYFPEGEGNVPLCIISNGLEGTVQELCFPNLKNRDRGIAMFAMEMPGAYAYKKPMSPASQEIYSGVIDHFAGHPRVDADRISIVGVSFGGYWAARMAAVDPRVSRAVVCGAPIAEAFKAKGSLGTPEIIISVLKKVTHATDLQSLQKRLGDLSFDIGNLYSAIKCPMLIINGDNDTLVGTEDSIILNARVERSFLKLYADDDHCAMGHYDEWLDLTIDWLLGNT